MNNTTNFSDTFLADNGMNLEYVLKSKQLMNYQKVLLFTKYNVITHTVMMLFGIPGNILCILTIRQKSFSEMSRTPIIITLSLIDILYLTIQYIRTVYTHTHKGSILHISNITCKFGDFSYLFCVHMDAWMIVVMSIERFVAVYKPYTVKRIFTSVKIKCIVISLILLFLLLDVELCFRSVHFNQS